MLPGQSSFLLPVFMDDFQTFYQLYQQTSQQSGFEEDPSQHNAVRQLDQLSQSLLFPEKSRWLQRPCAVNGVYLWGPVGRGKTFLLDLFTEFLPGNMVTRLHFHHFMDRIHQQLQEISGQKNPLNIIARQFSGECKVLCFDEFFVSDIGDAMILSGLLQSFIDQGIVLVATSNTPPGELYKDGLQRQRFLPAIKLLQQHLNIVHMDGSTDHRLRRLTLKENYFLQPADEQLGQLFSKYSSGETSDQPVSILGREIRIIQRCNNCIWFRFSDLCEGPRSQLDYIRLAELYRYIFLSDVPQLGGKQQEWIKARGVEDGSSTAGFESTRTGERQIRYARMDDPARRFISLIDELYDQRTCLFLSAAVPLAELYPQGGLEFEFNRTRSRLTEMRSAEYQNIDGKN